MRILIVGAGFAGAVYARTLADQGHPITVIDKRGHIAGNAHDAIDANGVRVHTYGPHLFHTNNAEVVAWLRRFGDFMEYEHSVTVRSGESFLPLPISRGTFEAHYGRRFGSDAAFRSFLDEIVEPCEAPRSAAELLHATIGQAMTDLLFRPYTRKMWGLSLEEMGADVVRRIAVIPGYEHRYFPKDRYQLLPAAGYTDLFANILDHRLISVRLGTPYDHAMRRDFDHVFSAAAIDEHYDFRFGELPYRSIRFHHRSQARGADPQPTSVVNFSDDGPYTRTTHWHMLPGHDVRDTGVITATLEEPCDFRDNGYERYYPINDAAGSSATLYDRCRDLAKGERDLTFIGRCGTYRYLDMHQVIAQSLMGANRWLSTTLVDA